MRIRITHIITTTIEVPRNESILLEEQQKVIEKQTENDIGRYDRYTRRLSYYHP